MPLKCIAVDDEPLALALIKSYIDATEALELLHVFEDALAAAEFLKHAKVDLLFLDINMPDISGIDLFASLTEKPMVIFTTAYKNFAFQGFELNATDYLLKPIEYTRFKKAVNKAIEYHEFQEKKHLHASDESIFVYTEYKLVKIPLNDILYIESLEDYVKIHLSNDSMILTLISLKKILEKLPSETFKRIHRSYVVPIKKVKSILNRKATLTNGITLPISDTYATFIDTWKNNV
ncbi:LytR/AlgR family response regulator transcription factor [Pedobacter sp. MW01-1-1]|uniref:LytR/AlgR family response regulator transcription factor n=1 Tax=Pedobacter sp. MW01-1-1 TaxID=3383027 RepID=UPI003FEE681E